MMKNRSKQFSSTRVTAALVTLGKISTVNIFILAKHNLAVMKCRTSSRNDLRKTAKTASVITLMPFPEESMLWAEVDCDVKGGLLLLFFIHDQNKYL